MDDLKSSPVKLEELRRELLASKQQQRQEEEKEKEETIALQSQLSEISSKLANCEQTLQAEREKAKGMEEGNNNKKYANQTAFALFLNF